MLADSLNFNFPSLLSSLHAPPSLSHSLPLSLSPFPTGALLGWLVFKDIFGPLVYGCLFGIIAGMMVFISLKELIPTAHKFDRRGILVAVFLVVGMVIMAASLLLFLY